VNERTMDVNAEDKYGDTPAHYAASTGKLDILKYLLKEKKTQCEHT